MPGNDLYLLPVNPQAILFISEGWSFWRREERDLPESHSRAGWGCDSEDQRSAFSLHHPALAPTPPPRGNLGTGQGHQRCGRLRGGGWSQYQVWYRKIRRTSLKIQNWISKLGYQREQWSREDPDLGFHLRVGKMVQGHQSWHKSGLNIPLLKTLHWYPTANLPT